jgi:TetR/AcrR family transcriptional regulator, lmrAB and yxaGH operons repressor
MAPPRLTRDEATDRLAGVFRRHGYEGATLSLFTEATGLGRASLYHHFPGGKEEMARAVFARVGEAVDRDLLAPLREKASPRARLERFARGLRRVYAEGNDNCLLGAMVLGGGLEPFRRELDASFRLLIDGLAAVLREAGQPRAQAARAAEDAIVRVQGALVVSRGLGDTGPFERLVKGLPDDLLG